MEHEGAFLLRHVFFGFILCWYQYHMCTTCVGRDILMSGYYAACRDRGSDKVAMEYIAHYDDTKNDDALTVSGAWG